MRSAARQSVHEGRIGGSVPERRPEAGRPDLEGNWRHPRHHERGTKPKLGSRHAHPACGHRGRTDAGHSGHCGRTDTGHRGGLRSHRRRHRHSRVGRGSHGSPRRGRRRSTGERSLVSGPLGRGCGRSDRACTSAPGFTRQRRLLPGPHRDDRGHGRSDQQPIDAARGSDVFLGRIERLEEAGPPAHDDHIGEGPEADAGGEHGVRVDSDSDRGVDDPAASEQAKKQHRCEHERHRGQAEQPVRGGRVSTLSLTRGCGGWHRRDNRLDVGGQASLGHGRDPFVVGLR